MVSLIHLNLSKIHASFLENKQKNNVLGLKIMVHKFGWIGVVPVLLKELNLDKDTWQ